MCAKKTKLKNVVTSKDMAAISTYYLEIQSLHPFKIFPLHLRSDLDCTPLGPPPLLPFIIKANFERLIVLRNPLIWMNDQAWSFQFGNA